MCQIFVDPGDSLGKEIPLLGVETGIVFLAILKGHNGVLILMLHKIDLLLQRVVKAL